MRGRARDKARSMSIGCSAPGLAARRPDWAEMRLDIAGEGDLRAIVGHGHGIRLDPAAVEIQPHRLPWSPGRWS